MQHTHARLLLLPFLFSPIFSIAQMQGGAAFLQGDYLEIGIAACGAYGTAQAPPAIGAAGTVYHPTETGLGFVADAGMDGWEVGSPPYCGDYFLPGSPVEGFVMNIDGRRYNNSSGFGICGVEEIPGSIVDYSAGDTLSATWEGVHTDGFRLSIRTYFPRNKRYFIGEVTLVNTGSANLQDIYFSRQVDPDNDQAWGGGFPTFNRIVSQPGESSADALVSAEGTMGCYLGLGARHFASRVSRGGFFIGNAQDPYCANSPYSHSGSATSDDAIGVNFYFARLEPGKSLTFSYAYILDEEELEEALMATTAPVLLADGIPVQVEEGMDIAQISLCAGDSVYLEVQGGDNYTWDWNHFGDFSADSPLSGWLKPNAPHVYSVSSAVPCGLEIAFNFQVDLGESATLLASIPDQSICPGLPLALNGGVDLSALSLEWSPALWVSDPNSAAALFAPDTANAVFALNVRASDAQGCAAEDVVIVTVHPEAQISAGPDKVGVIGTRISLEGSGAVDYQWSPANLLNYPSVANPQALVLDTTVFTLVGRDLNGCLGEDEMTLYALVNQRFVVPNAFTPDGDGLNDCFRAGSPVDMDFLDLRIFNRWGELVFHAQDEGQCWDGQYQGKPQPLGSYVVMLRLIDQHGKIVDRNSSLTLIR